MPVRLRMRVCDCNRHGYVVWATSDLAGVRTTTPHLLAPGSETLDLTMSASGMALCFLVWTPVDQGHFQLVAVESRYLQTAAHSLGHTTVHKDGCVQITGPFNDVTESVFEMVATWAAPDRVRGAMASEPIISQPAGMLANAGYIINTHKDPWFTAFPINALEWHPVPSMFGYPALAATALDATIWGKAVRMAAVLLCHPHNKLPVSDDQASIITVCALTVFAGMYNATPETSDDRKGEFMSLGTNGDCDDMAIACAAVANYLIANPVLSPPGSLAARCHHWLQANVSAAVICLGFAVGKVADPTAEGADFGFRPTPTTDPVYDEKTGAGHCWAALLPIDEIPENRLQGALMLESTRQTYNWPGEELASLKDLGFPKADTYDPFGEASVYAHTIKPLAPDQYKRVVYVIDANGLWLVHAGHRFGASWDEATKTALVGTRRIGPPHADLYEALEAQLDVPALHRYDLVDIDRQWSKHKDDWETLTHGAPLHATDVDAIPDNQHITNLSHVDAGSRPYSLGFGVQFGLQF